jgi:hypothetical protein
MGDRAGRGNNGAAFLGTAKRRTGTAVGSLSTASVKTCYGSKATQLGGSNPEGLARILIRELAGMRTRWLC